MKQLMKVGGVLGIAMLLAACEEPPSRQQLRENADKVVRKIHYIKDGDSGLCFAYIDSNTHNSWVVHSIAGPVDCDKVSHLLENLK